MSQELRSRFTRYRYQRKYFLDPLGMLCAATSAVLLVFYASATSWGAAMPFLVVLALAGSASWLVYHLLNREIHHIASTLDTDKTKAAEFLKSVEESLGAIRDGDLTVTVSEMDSDGEFREIAKVLGGMIQGFSGMLKKIQKTSAEVSLQAHKILETSGEQASGSSEQAAAVAEITSAMEELARTAAQIAENTHNVVFASEEAEKRAGEGMDHMKGNAASLERMNERMNDINENAHKLGEKFQEIDKILSLITSIASETHILALNAAIEAASAGEYGARFSVIASEVRRLSDMSQGAVDEIKKILGDFQKSIQNTILATEQGAKEFESAMEAAFMIQEKLSSITDKVGHTTLAAREISLATQQQKTASDQIVDTLKDVSSVIRQIANALQEFNRAATRLNNLSMDMQIIAQSFIIASDRNIKFLVRNAASHPDIRGFSRHNPTSFMEDLIEKNSFIEIAFLADSDGSLAAWALPEYLKSEKNVQMLGSVTNCAQRPWFMAVKDSRKPYITNMYKSSMTNEDCFSISAPVFSEKNDFIGVIGIDINAANWSKID